MLGDLVNRGPQSLAMLRRLRGLGGAATCVLGNHDLHLLAVAPACGRAHRSDTFDDILDAPDRDAWLDWLRHRRMAVHRARLADAARRRRAAVGPGDDAGARRRRSRRRCASAPPREFLGAMFGNEPLRWSDSLPATTRLRFTLNVLTRIRFGTDDGMLEFDDQGRRRSAHRRALCRGSTCPAAAPPARRSRSATGRALGLRRPARPARLDTGCVWGGKLTAVRIDGGRREIVQVGCTGAPRKPEAHPRRRLAVDAA